MADFIKREAVLARAKTLHEIQYGTGTRTLVDVSAVCVSDIEDILAADVVEVVRCKDCHWYTKLEECPQGRCELAGFYPTGEWFCANGVPKSLDERS